MEQISNSSHITIQITNEYNEHIHLRTVPTFDDIIDEKHKRYIDAYAEEPSVFWGIGIENECYLLLNHSFKAIKEFTQLKLKSERYSVNYFNNFKSDPLVASIKKLYTCKKLTYPTYINAHTFDKMDPTLKHRTTFEREPKPTPGFTESLHEILMRESEYYRNITGVSTVFDGDSIEFITQQFHNTTVSNCVNELVTLKQSFLSEVSPYFEKWGIGSISFPSHNYGLATFLSTNTKNLGVCNNATYHINMTLPTLIQNGCIVDKPAFIQQHLEFVRCIQMVEPLIVACYGTPDVLSIVDPTTSNHYSMGSLRVTLSRYISLQTFDTYHPINGKLLLMKKSSDPSWWYNQLDDSSYHMNEQIGADINFNKFKNHGVEMRFLDWFPEDYLEGLMNFFVLLAQHSVSIGSFHFQPADYQNITLSCVTKGFAYVLSPTECNVMLHDLKLQEISIPMTAFELLSHICDILYLRYFDAPIVQQMAPYMPYPRLVNYNWIAFQELYHDIHGKPDLILRSEENPLESRTTIIPDHVSLLQSHYTVLVESSSTRCFSDEDYQKKGATIVPAGHWEGSQHSYVIGLKGFQSCAKKHQTHMHFAHCFKGQPDSATILQRIAPSIFIDYEFMVNKEKKRMISFCKQSGKIGCYVALMTYYRKLQKMGKNKITDIPPFDQKLYDDELSALVTCHKPKVLLIGFGIVGKACKEVLDWFGITCTVWTTATIDKPKDVIMQHDILLHATSLRDITYEPFLEKSDLEIVKTRAKRADLYDPVYLSVICDISCDLGNPRNLLPIYDTYTTKEHPIIPLPCHPSIDLIAIPYLPSLEPIVSSIEFSSALISYLRELLYFHHTKAISEKSQILYYSYQSFCNMLQ